jgi:hypothetical protein
MANEETQSKDLGDGYVVSVNVLPGRRGLRCFNRLLQVLGAVGDGVKPALKAIAPALGGKQGKPDAELGAGLLSALKGFNPDDVDFLGTELLSPAVMSCPDGRKLPLGNAGHFDTVFAGRVDLFYKALFFALQVNYGGFLKGWVQGIVAGLPTTPVASK